MNTVYLNKKFQLVEKFLKKGGKSALLNISKIIKKFDMCLFLKIKNIENSF